MFWADHYVAHDGLAAAGAAHRDDSVSWRSAVADLLEARPLVEAEIFVPVFTDLTIALVDEAVDAMVAVDLANPNYVAWAERQIVIEGPTAREAAFVHVVDDYPHDGWFYLLNRLDPSSVEQPDPGGVLVRGRLLNRYDPAHDYTAWLLHGPAPSSRAAAQATRQRACRGGNDRSRPRHRQPFRARALRRRRAPLPPAGDFDIGDAVWAEVPWLPDASPDLLVKIAKGEPRVEELRRATAAALRTVEAGDLAAGARESPTSPPTSRPRVTSSGANCAAAAWLTLLLPLVWRRAVC
jgi:hypothetical protein